MAARKLMLGGAPVLMYHGIGDSIPAGASDREGRYWVSPESLERQLAPAYNFLGMAYFLLGDEVHARAEFVRMLSLPLHLRMEDGDVDDVIDAVESIVHTYRR